MKFTRLIFASVLLAAVAACGGGSGGGGSVAVSPPLPASKTYSITLTSVEIDRAADQIDIMVEGLPVDGATVVVDE